MRGFIELNVSQKPVEDSSTDELTLAGLISDEVCSLFNLIVICVLVESVSILGTVSNIINIICYVKQGFKDSANVNFLALAISDFGSLLTAIFCSIAYIPQLQEIDQPVDIMQIAYLVLGWPHIIFARVTSWITALITLERCLCITMPLKVRSFCTPRRAAMANIGLYIIMIGCVCPVYHVNNCGWTFSPERNRSIFGLVFKPDREYIEQIAFTLNHIILPFAAFLIVIVCVITLDINLQRKARWREKSTSAQHNYNISVRDQKLGRTIVVIATLFVISYIPMCLSFFAPVFVPGMSFDGYNRNLLIVCASISVLLEVLNSSVNILIYYHMSSKYRQVFKQSFQCFKEKR